MVGDGRGVRVGETHNSRVTYPEQGILSLLNHQARDFLVVHGLPGDHLLFSASPDSTPLVSMDGRQFIRIGDVGNADGLCIDIHTGETVVISDVDGQVWHVNDAVNQFADSLDLFTGRFPFYPANAGLDLREAAVDSLRLALARIDGTALREDPGFWNSILFDVGIGDYADE